MRARSWITAFSIAVVFFSITIQDSLAKSGIKARFDLPAESLDKALRDFALQANCNISYVPSAVAGLQAPAIKGEFTVSGVLSMLLTGTRLVAVNVNENTIQVVERPAATSESYGSSSSNVVRLAYAGPDIATPPNTSPPSPATDSDAIDKNAWYNKDLEEIVVTGTHIRGVLLASPVTEIGREEIDRSGYTSIADVMLSLPQNFGGGYNAGTIVVNSQINNRFADNPSGASVPNLRGLGPGSTLTLIDGHRMASGLTGGGADISSIPIDAIDRIEVVTDSASAVYGSDAVAGVVNVILKKNYDGAITSLSYGSASQGGATERRASQLFGTNWNGGDIVIAYEFRSQDTIQAEDRAFTSSALQPNWLLPQTRSHSVTLSASQDLIDSTSAFVDALYVSRDADHIATDQFAPAPAAFPTTLRKYAVSTGIDTKIGGDWSATIFVSAAEDATVDDGVFFTVPTETPGSAERLVGTMRAIEANANGTVATLPSGPVRIALGAGYRKEYFSDDLGTTGAAPVSTTQGNRNVRYAFGELSIPLVEHSSRIGLNYFDLIASARNERYSDFGEKTVPKVGLVYGPTPSIKLRTTWGKAFRAPNLFDIFETPSLDLVTLPSPASAAGSPSLIRDGGNPNLEPETAESWSVGADYSPAEIAGLRVSTTAFDIKYTNRISQISNVFTALTDPLNSFFVTPVQSAGVAQSLYDSYPPMNIFNLSGAPFDASRITSIVDFRLVNVSRQTARGADLSVDYRLGAESSGVLLFFNGTFLDLTQQDTPQSPSQTLSGLAFYPSRFRLRSGATWKWNSWALTGTTNFLPHETNNQVAPFQNVGSWTTLDASLRYAPPLSGLLRGLNFNLSAINLFNRNPPLVLLPPTVQQGFNYDSSNTSAIGRFVRLQVSKRW